MFSLKSFQINLCNNFLTFQQQWIIYSNERNRAIPFLKLYKWEQHILWPTSIKPITISLSNYLSVILHVNLGCSFPALGPRSRYRLLHIFIITSEFLYLQSCLFKCDRFGMGSIDHSESIFLSFSFIISFLSFLDIQYSIKGSSDENE